MKVNFTRRVACALVAFMLTIGIIGAPISVRAEEVDSSVEETQVDYLVVDQKELTIGDSQKVVVALSNYAELTDVVLSYHEELSGQEYQCAGEEHSDGMFLFVVNDIQVAGKYRIDRVEFNCGGEKKEIDLSEVGIDASWGVDTEVTTSPDDYIVEDDTIDAEVVGEDGELTEANSLSDALNQASSSNANGGVFKYGSSKKMTIVLDPGHDSTHAGACVAGYSEAALNLKIANYCKAYLEKYNVNVYMTRTGEGCPHPGTTSVQDNRQRVAFAQSVGADVYVSIHLNTSGSSSVNGAEVYYPNGSYRGDIGNTGAGLAAAEMQELTALGLKNNGTKIRNSEDNSTYPDGSLADYYGVIKNSKLSGFTGIIIEHAYMSNASNRSNYLSTEEQLKRLGEADAKGLVNYYGLSTMMDLTGVFDYNYYYNTYSDLRSAIGLDEKKLYDHFINFGLYEGRTASPVFNINYYMNRNSDLRAAFGNDRILYCEHFMDYGMSEGRQAIDTFNVYSYKNQYADLRSAFGNDLKSYYLHYMNFGVKEGRKGTGCENKIVATTTYNGMDYSAVYDYQTYINNYNDLKSAFGNDDVAALKHFVEFGMSEGRQAKSTFDVNSYRLQYVDLRSAFGNDLKKYYEHYMSCGKKEGRAGTGCTALMGATTTYNGVDYSAVYDFNTYISNYSDLKNAFGNDDVSALEHFVKSGMSEGRQAKSSFDVNSYRLQYADLRRAFGNDLKKYYEHYMICGKKEGRTGTGCTTLQGAITTYNGVDYSAVYDYQTYINTYADLKSAFGNDDIAALKHFVEFGMSEGRQAKTDFYVQSYKNRYADLQAAFGNNLKSYYMHYISYGSSEGRQAN